MISNRRSTDFRRAIVFLLSTALLFNDNLKMSKNYPAAPSKITIVPKHSKRFFLLDREVLLALGLVSDRGPPITFLIVIGNKRETSCIRARSATFLFCCLRLWPTASACNDDRGGVTHEDVWQHRALHSTTVHHTLNCQKQPFVYRWFEKDCYIYTACSIVRYNRS
jgi:hypothetical protein